MYKIFICEDEDVYCEAHAAVCQLAMDELGIECSITKFHSGNEFLEKIIEEDLQYDIGFLNILMEGADGLEVAREIRKRNSDTKIVFLTSCLDYALSGYSVNAFQYLIKPDANAIKKVIEADYKQRFQRNFIVLDSDIGAQSVDIQDIVSIEITGRKVTVRMIKGIAYYSGKLTELLDRLPKSQFIRCHLSFAVNIYNIKEITPKNAIAITGQKIPISRTYKNEVKKAFIQQVRNDFRFC